MFIVAIFSKCSTCNVIDSDNNQNCLCYGFVGIVEKNGLNVLVSSQDVLYILMQTVVFFTYGIVSSQIDIRHKREKLWFYKFYVVN